jgi:hypothetical protein
MITIRKAVANRVPPDQLQAAMQAPAAEPGLGDDAAAARLRHLAAHLASYQDLRVSVITFEDGSTELEVLLAGPPHHTSDTIDRGRFAGRATTEPGWVVDLAGDSALERATDLIRTTLLEG